MDILLKEDKKFKLFFRPQHAGSISFGDETYIDMITGKEVIGEFKIYKHLYDSFGNRLAVPFVTPTNHLVPKEV